MEKENMLNLADYISATSDLKDKTTVFGALTKETFEDLIGNKYRKFLNFFEIVKDYSEYIKTMEYEFTENGDTLSVKITFTKDVTLDDKKELINEMKESGYSVEKSKLKAKQMKLKITYKE